MFIQKASLDDLDAIVELDTSFSAESGEPVYSEDQWYNFIVGGEHVFCCQGDSGAIAVLLAFENYDGSIQLQKIFVAEEYRYQEIGHYLMEEFDILQSVSRTCAFLCVASDNSDAKRFYRRHGFTADTDDGIETRMSRDFHY